MRNIIFLGLMLVSSAIFSQEVKFEGYIFEDGNRGYLNEVQVKIFERMSSTLVAELYSNEEGYFETNLPINKDYDLKAIKDGFGTIDEIISTKGTAGSGKAFAKLKMKRMPGYIFEATLANERVDADEPVNAISGSLIEIYNITKDKEVLVLKDHPYPTFRYRLEDGNHYTIMIRKEGYFTKRIEAYVNVDGCILCIDGVSELSPGVADNLTEGNAMGSLLANIELKKAEVDKTMTIENIYYDYNKSDIRKDAAIELDKLVKMLKANPSILVELGSHTDSRGKDQYNLELSQKRAQAAVDYITQMGEIENFRITAQGYGESKLANKCKNGVNCSDEEHQANRRTELKVTGFISDKEIKPLAEIIRLEKMDMMLQDIMNGNTEVYEAKPIEEEDEMPVMVDTSIEEEAPAITDTNVAMKSFEEVHAGNKSVVAVPAKYSGYRVQVVESAGPLTNDNPFFKKHGGISCSIGPAYYYYLGSFQNKAAAVDLLNKIKTQYPRARVIGFINGERN